MPAGISTAVSTMPAITSSRIHPRTHLSVLAARGPTTTVAAASHQRYGRTSERFAASVHPSTPSEISMKKILFLLAILGAAAAAVAAMRPDDVKTSAKKASNTVSKSAQQAQTAVKDKIQPAADAAQEAAEDAADAVSGTSDDAAAATDDAVDAAKDASTN